MTVQAPTVCIHHAPCADGFTAAWAVWKRFGDQVKFVPGVHGKPPPDVTGEHVVIVDFSYPKETLLKMAEAAASVLVLDHHATAQRDLEGFPPPAGTWEGHVEEAAMFRHLSPLDRIGVRFDMNRSGAMMAWEYFNHYAATPRLVKHVQDRDLWKFELAGTREIQSWVFSFPYDFQTWDGLARDLQTTAGWNSAFAQGEALERKHQKDVAELIDATMRYMVIGGHKVPVVNIPYTMVSDAAGTLAEGNLFAAGYFDADNGDRVFSLRSRGDFDVGALAKQMGALFGTTGGGHKKASGFRAPRGWEGEGGL